MRYSNFEFLTNLHMIPLLPPAASHSPIRASPPSSLESPLLIIIIIIIITIEVRASSCQDLSHSKCPHNTQLVAELVNVVSPTASTPIMTSLPVKHPHDQDDVSKPSCRRPPLSSRVYLTIFVLQSLISVLMLYIHHASSTKKYHIARNTRYNISTLLYNTSHPHFLNSLKPFTVIHNAHRSIAFANPSNNSNIDHDQNRVLTYFFHDYIKFHARNRYNASRVLIFRPHPTGLGDRFGLLLYAYWFAVLSRRVFLIDWTSPFPLTDFLVTANTIANTDIFFRDEDERFIPQNLTNFNGHVRHTRSFEIITDLDYIRSDRTNVQTLLAPENKARTIIMQSRRTLKSAEMLAFVQRTIPPEFVKSDAKYFARQLGASEADFHRMFAHHVVKPSNRIVNDYLAICRQLHLRCSPSYTTSSDTYVADSLRGLLNIVGLKSIRGMASSRYIGVHARVGVGVGEKMHERFHNLSLDLQVPARCLARRAVKLALMGSSTDGHSIKALPIFLATDTPSFRELFKEVVQKMSNDQVDVVFGTWDVVHSNRVVHGRGFSKELNEVARRKYWGAWMDLLMMGHSEHFISIYSSFPRLALALGDAVTLTEMRSTLC